MHPAKFSLEPQGYEGSCFVWDSGHNLYDLPLLQTADDPLEHHNHGKDQSCTTIGHNINLDKIEILNTRDITPQETVLNDMRLNQNTSQPTGEEHLVRIKSYDTEGCCSIESHQLATPKLGTDQVEVDHTRKDEGRRFKCPYGLRNSLQDQSSCSGIGWLNFHRLK